MGLQSPSKLLWGDPSVVGSVLVRIISHAWGTAPERDIAVVPVVPSPAREWHSYSGEAGHEEVGRGPCLPSLHPEHAPTLALAQVLGEGHSKQWQC